MRFKVGMKVRCIEKPPKSSYHCDVGEILVVRTMDGTIFYPVEPSPLASQYPKEHVCYFQHFFEEVKEVCITDIYKDF